MTPASTLKPLQPLPPTDSILLLHIIRYFQSIARRLYRILAHAFFHHSATFEEFEATHHTRKRFEELALAFELMPEKLLIIRQA